MLEQKQGQFWNLHRIPNKTSNPDFRFFCRFENCPCFYFLALIVFDFYSFEGSKTHFTGEANVYICIY